MLGITAIHNTQCALITCSGSFSLYIHTYILCIYIYIQTYIYFTTTLSEDKWYNIKQVRTWRLSKVGQYHTQTEFQFTPSTCTVYWIWISLPCPTLFLWLSASPSGNFTQASPSLPNLQGSRNLIFWCDLSLEWRAKHTERIPCGDLDHAKAICFASERERFYLHHRLNS